MEVPNIDSKLVEGLLHNLKPSKSPGPDGIHPRVLKKLAPPLAIIFRSSVSTGSIPQSWKTANITPIFKKEDKREPSNYCPVSLTCIVSRVLERIIRDNLSDHFRRNNLISDKQFGFLSGWSTTIQLIQVVEDWTKYLDCGNAIDVVYMDFMKAFDKVSHSHLIQKLTCLGVDVHSLHTVNCLHNFLTGRTQMVKYQNTISSRKSVISGVPQGDSKRSSCIFVFYKRFTWWSCF